MLLSGYIEICKYKYMGICRYAHRIYAFGMYFSFGVGIKQTHLF